MRKFGCVWCFPATVATRIILAVVAFLAILRNEVFKKSPSLKRLQVGELMCSCALESCVCVLGNSFGQKGRRRCMINTPGIKSVQIVDTMSS